MEYRYTAIVLKKQDIGEADRLYTFYTLEKGKIKAIARGVRKPHARLAGNLENFSLISLIIAKNRGMGNIKSAVVERNALPLKESLEVLQNTLFSLQQLEKMVELEHEDPTLFQFVEEYIQLQIQLAQSKKEGLSLLMQQAFYFQFLHILGYTLQTQSCVHCGKTKSFQKGFLSLSSGGILCDTCGVKKHEKRSFSQETIKLLRVFSHNTITSCQKLIVSQSQVRELEGCMQYYLQWVGR